jgi:DNA repair exonuclease SbcCD nuclease subunit
LKIIATSDWHFDAVTAGKPRLREFFDYREKLVEVIRKEKPALLAVGGDFFDPGGMNAHKYTSILLETVSILNEVAVEGGGVSVWIAGNHDVVETSEGFTTLSPLVYALEGGFSSGSDRNYKPNVFERPGLVEFSQRGKGREEFQVLALPYVAKSFGFDWSSVNRFAVNPRNLPLIVLGHLTVPGAIMGTESKEMARGRDLEMVDLEPFDPKVIINGHYHAAQIVEWKGRKVIIPGSPMRFNFGESQDKNKGYTLIEI